MKAPSRNFFPVFLLAALFLSPPPAWTQSPDIDPPSIEALRAAADSGDAEARYRLARAYERGDGVEQDDFAAVRWLRRAAEQDHPAAALDLGWMLANGYGVAQDPSEAYFWFAKAAALGVEQAAAQRDALAGSVDLATRTRVAAEVRSGASVAAPVASPDTGPATGVASDPVLLPGDTYAALRDRLNAGGGADVLAKLALLARDGDPLAQNLVGVALGRSENVADRRDGLDWLFRAARQGLPAAGYNLAAALMAGNADRAIDVDGARRWLDSTIVALDRIETQAGSGFDAVAREFSARSGITDPYRAAIQGSPGAYRELRELVRLKRSELIARAEFLRRRAGIEAGAAPVGGVETTVIE
jgi:TPR repeat protein